MDEEFQMELRKEERDKGLKRFDCQVFRGVEQVVFRPSPFSQQHVRVIGSVLVRLLRSKCSNSRLVKKRAFSQVV